MRGGARGDPPHPGAARTAGPSLSTVHAGTVHADTVHAGTVHPLLARGRLVTVDSHPVCADCGLAVAPDDAGLWQHVPPGRPFPRRSRWFEPVSRAALRGLRSYAEFTRRYPWTVTPELCGGAVTSQTEWAQGVRRLREYDGLLAGARRRPVLRAGENPYLELARVLAGGRREQELAWSVPGGLGHVLGLPARRRELAALFAWAIPGEGALAVLAGHAPLLECGAGTGYWAALLRARGVDVLASDVAPPGRPAARAPGGSAEGAPRNKYHHSGRRPWTEIATASAADAVRGARTSGRTLFLCWPPFDDDTASYDALRAYRGDTFIYAGGGPGGPTGTVRFHRELELNWQPAEQVALPNWPGLRDRLVVYRRNPVRRPLRQRDRCPGCRRFLPTGSVGRCDACFAKSPPAMALQVNGYRVEYPRAVVDAMPRGLRLAFERSPSLISRAGEPTSPTRS